MSTPTFEQRRRQVRVEEYLVKLLAAQRDLELANIDLEEVSQ